MCYASHALSMVRADQLSFAVLRPARSGPQGLLGLRTAIRRLQGFHLAGVTVLRDEIGVDGVRVGLRHGEDLLR